MNIWNYIDVKINKNVKHVDTKLDFFSPNSVFPIIVRMALSFPGSVPTFTKMSNLDFRKMGYKLHWGLHWSFCKLSSLFLLPFSPLPFSPFFPSSFSLPSLSLMFEGCPRSMKKLPFQALFSWCAKRDGQAWRTRLKDFGPSCVSWGSYSRGTPHSARDR